MSLAGGVRPTSICILGHVYPLTEVTDPRESLGRDASPTSLGYTDIPGQVMRIRASEVGPDVERETVLHEIVHVILHLTWADQLFEDRAELERIVTPLGLGLHNVLRANPDLVAWLTV